MTSAGVYVVDDEDRIVGARGSVEETLGPFLSHSLWEVLPGAEELFRRHFEEARRTRREVEFTDYYAGELSQRRVVPTGETLTVYVTPLLTLDVTTLATLAESLSRIEDELVARAPERLAAPARVSLRALP